MLCLPNGLAQDSYSIPIYEELKSSPMAEVNFRGDQRVQELFRKHIQINKSKDGIKGWRIRIYSDLGKEARRESLKAKQKIQQMYSDIPVYRKYQAPYFKVYVGDFRTRNKAYKMLQQIKKEYSEAFMIYTEINYPEL